MLAKTDARVLPLLSSDAIKGDTGYPTMIQVCMYKSVIKFSGFITTVACKITLYNCKVPI